MDSYDIHEAPIIVKCMVPGLGVQALEWSQYGHIVKM